MDSSRFGVIYLFRAVLLRDGSILACGMYIKKHKISLCWVRNVLSKSLLAASGGFGQKQGLCFPLQGRVPVIDEHSCLCMNNQFFWPLVNKNSISGVQNDFHCQQTLAGVLVGLYNDLKKENYHSECLEDFLTPQTCISG